MIGRGLGRTVVGLMLFAAGGLSPALGQQNLSVPTWHTSFVYNGVMYPIQIVGADPSLGTTTLVANAVVPLRLVFSTGTVLDGSAETNALLASPVFTSAPFPSGTNQYADAVVRAEFWQFAQASDYHVLLDTPTVESTYVLQVPAADGSASAGPRGEVKGVVDFNWFVKTQEPLIVEQLGISPTSLTIFLTRNVRLTRGPESSFGGEHYSFDIQIGYVRERFTTVWAGASNGDIVSMSHEINEWVHDPFNENAVPPWSKPGANDCNKHLEVADPLVGTLFTINGYKLQDVAYIDWFSREVPSSALSGLYDVLGRLTGPATSCSETRLPHAR